MKKNLSAARLIKAEEGDTLFSFLVAILLSSIMFAAFVDTFSSATKHGADHFMMIEAQQEAKTIADLMAFELRLLGSGVPFTQANFAIGDATLGTAPLPIFLDATETNISFRINERGRNTTLSADFDPSLSLQVSVVDASIFEIEDTIYITDMTAGGNDGLRGEVLSIAGNVLTIDATYTAGASATFPAGSVIEPVKTITYANSIADDAITRDAEFGAVQLSRRCSFTLGFVDALGNTLPLPLTDTVVRDDLTGVQVTVSVDSSRPLLSGSTYTAEASHSVAFRNLIYSR